MSKLKFFPSTNSPKPTPVTPEQQPESLPVGKSKYVPNYVQMGIQPVRRDSTWAPNPQVPVKKVDSEEQKAARFKEIYAQLSGAGVEQSFHLDNEIEQFGEVDMNHPMLDNQNFILDEDEEPTLVTSTPTIEAVSHNSGILNALDIEADDYVLYLDGNPLCAGTKEEIEKMTSDLVFGISKELILDAVEVDRLSVFKKMNIKMGLFLG